MNELNLYYIGWICVYIPILVNFFQPGNPAVSAVLAGVTNPKCSDSGSCSQIHHSHFTVSNPPCQWWICASNTSEKQELMDQLLSPRRTNYLPKVLLFTLFFWALLCFTLIPPCPRISPHCTIFNGKKKKKSDRSWIFMLSPRFPPKCMPALVWFLDTRTSEYFCSVIFSPPGCFDKQCHRKTSYLPPLPIRKRKECQFICLSSPSLSVSLPPPLLSCVCFVFAMRSSAQEDALVAQG